MTLEKAIEKLNHLADPSYFLVSTDESDALQLGIEALKRVAACRPPFGRDNHSLLPSETKD